MNRITQYLRLDDLLQVDDETFTFDGSDLDVPLHNNQLRHYDPTPGRWLSEEPIGYHADDVNVTPYVDRPPPPQ